MTSALKEHLPNYSYQDYCNWEGNWELIEGVPYAMSPLPSGKHQWIARKLCTLLDNQLTKCKRCNVSFPMDWKVNDNTVIQPDLFVACFDFKKQQFISEPPVIIVEILSPSTRDKDIFVKHQIYREQGVKYYVIIDPENDTYKIHKLAGEEYVTAKSGHNGSFTFELHKDCKPEVDFGKIWE